MYIILALISFAVLAIYSVFNLFNMYVTFDSLLVQMGVIVLVVMSTIIVARYILLIIFSILKTIQKTSDSNIKFHTKSHNYKVSIIIPAFNEEKVIINSIKSIMNQTYSNIEIIVIDDGSKDSTFRYAKILEFNDGHRSLKAFNKKNGGKAVALNYGVERSSGDLIMVVDADSELSDNAIELMVGYFQNPQIGAVAGSVYVKNHDSMLTRLQALEYIEGLNMVRNGQAFLKLVTIIPGPIGIFRKTALMDVGGYDHDTFAEDCDLTLKLIEKGYKIDFEPDALAITEAPDELLDLIKQRYRWTRGILQSIRKHKKHLWRLKSDPAMSFVLWYMLFESIFWPFFDLWANIFFIYISATTGASTFIFFWWILYTTMDIAGALYCLILTKEPLYLALYAFFYRLYFITIINVSKILATAEEWLHIDMTWGKLDRRGS